MSMWAHMDAKAGEEEEWESKWHATENMMKQFLACYKREQLVELERQKFGTVAAGADAGKAGITTGKGFIESRSASSSSGYVDTGKGGVGLQDIMEEAPPQNILQKKAGLSGSWASRGGWGGSSTGRF